MKISVCVLILAFWSVSVIAQTDPKEEIRKGVAVKVDDWGSKIYHFDSTFWNIYKPVIEKQVGVAEFDRFKHNVNRMDIPAQFNIFDGRKKLKMEEYAKRMNLLNVYKIASFDLLDGAQQSLAILRVPYKENKQWNAEVTWDTVYLVVDERSVNNIKN